eukprot:2262086-Pyramimonas_sp.AAC.1
MDFGQVPGHLHYAGYIYISYWNGTEFVEVNYTNDNRFVNATYSEVITITFDAVVSDKFHIRVEKGPNNNTVHVGLSEWTIYGVTPKQRLSDLVDTQIGITFYSEVFASNRISGGYQQSLPNGDIVHSSNTHQPGRTAVSLFDTHTVNWANAWHGPAGVTTMYAIYEFANGESKAVSSMSFGQVPSANHYAGDIYIYYWDGTDFVSVNYTSDYKFTSNTFGETIINEVMYNGFNGNQIHTEIFFGPTFYYRLKHMVNDKMNYRGGSVDPSSNPVTGTTKQPTHGRANQGGLRIGEMETNALLAHGIGDFIKESMMERSDKYRFNTSVQELNSSALDKKQVQVETPYTPDERIGFSSDKVA